MLVFNNGGSLTETFVQTGVGVLPGGGVTQLGSLQFSASDRGNIRLWRVGVCDKSGGEFNLGNHSREYNLGASVPADVLFQCDTFDAGGRGGSGGGNSGGGDGGVSAVGLAQDPNTAWPYAQTQAGTFTIQFRGGQAFKGAAQLYVATSMQQGRAPSVALNGVPFNGALPDGTDDPLTRQAVRSAWGQATMLEIDAGVIVKGLNNLTFTKASTDGGGTGWDAIILEVPSQ
jgi:rhamnogalacturonan endolyase